MGAFFILHTGALSPKGHPFAELHDFKNILSLYFYMYYWETEDVYKRLDKKMTTAYHTVLNTSKKYNINMRQAAYVVAVERVVEAMKLRGWA